MGKVYIKNFGDGNYLWDEARDTSSIILISDKKAHDLFIENKEDEYRAYVKNTLKTSKGQIPYDGTITLWWNAHKKFHNSVAGDIWVHDDSKYLYWTKLVDNPVEFEVRPDPFPRGRENVHVVLSKRKTDGWKRKDINGRSLLLNGLHPKTKSVVRTQMTIAEPSHSNSEYIRSLISGGDLRRWYQLGDWKEAKEKSNREIGISYTDWQIRLYEMWQSVNVTVAKSGLSKTTVYKDKSLGFSNEAEFKNYVMELDKKQKGFCKLTALKYRISKSENNYLRVSIDRIDSDKGYIKGNLQLVCWFANKWKSDMDNKVFLELIELLKVN